MTDDRDELPRFADLEAEYEILRELGRGGTAVVYLARERELGREVAIKVIRSTFIEDREAAARLIREARTVAVLQHPNIVLLYGTRRLRDRSLALIMQYVPGHTLRSEVRAKGPLPVGRVERVLGDLARALQYAHGEGIVHRDIKPENIYLDEHTGTARLADFGIARPVGGESGLTLPGTAIGTPAFMSPEQIDGGKLDGRSDIYSLGLIGYEMLTGRPPWDGSSLYSMIYRQKHEMLPSPALERNDIPQRVLIALEGSLRKDPADRWRDAGEFLDALAGRITTLRPVAGLPAATPQVATQSPSMPTDGLTVQFRRDQVGPPAVVTPSKPQHAPAAWHAATGGVSDTSTENAGGVFRHLRAPLVGAAVLALLLVGVATTVALSIGPGSRDNGNGDDVAAAPPATVTSPAGTGAAPGTPAAALALAGAIQEGVAGDTLQQWLVLRVEDAAGRPVAGVPVQFRVTAGDGETVPGTVTTDEMGLAGAKWLVRSAGLHEAEAAVDGQTHLTAAFRASVTQRRPARLTAVSPTRVSAQEGAAGAPLVVQVADDRGNPIPGVTVQFAVRSGGGRTTPAAVATDSTGTARAEWVIGTDGAQEVAATVNNVSDAVSFRAAAPPAAVRIRSGVTAGGTHTCALNSEGAAACWGGNDSGQIGDGSTSRRPLPARVQAPERLAGLSAGVSHTCAVGVTGAVFCWGSNTNGQLGNGTRSASAEPVRVGTSEVLVAVTAGMSHSCALDPSGRAFCWGSNANGQLGDESRTSRTRPVAVLGGIRFRSLAAGWNHTCGLRSDGAAYCWGRNQAGELGIGTTGDRTQPVAVAGGNRFTELAAGNAHTCGLRTDGAILCWGSNAYGQLGAGGGDSRSSPVTVQADGLFTRLVAGGVHTCGLHRDGTALCWGRNVYGQLGDGSMQDRDTPAPVAGGLRFAALHATGAHTCGTTTDGVTYCWGFNIEGQLGDRTRTNQPRPVAVDRAW